MSRTTYATLFVWAAKACLFVEEKIELKRTTAIVVYTAHSYFCGNHFKDKMASPRHVTKSVARVVKVLYVKCSSCCLTIPTSVDVSLSLSLMAKDDNLPFFSPPPRLADPFPSEGRRKAEVKLIS